MAKDSMKDFGIVAVIAIVVVGISFLVGSKTSPQANVMPDTPDLSSPTIAELSTAGYTKVNVDAQFSAVEGAVILKGGCYELVGSTEPWIAQSIANGLQNRTGFRPNAHDVMKDAMNSFGIKVSMVKVVEIRNSTYIGNLILQQGNKVVNLDVRPSDGTAIAVRVGAPVYVKDSVLQTQGKNIC